MNIVETQAVKKGLQQLKLREWVDGSDPDFPPTRRTAGRCETCGSPMDSAVALTCFPELCRWRQRVTRNAAVRASRGAK